jgi:hypothetical protein
MNSLTEDRTLAPDLLRRFVETPFHGTWQVGTNILFVETNEENILRVFAHFSLQQSPPTSPIRLKAIVDSELQLSEAMPIMMETRDVVWARGKQSLLVFDRQSSEIAVFMSRFVPENFMELLLEVLIKHTEPSGAGILTSTIWSACLK